ncbi:MAG: oxidoreductase [Candidatus Sulfotelmatobacter sp.]|nr:oxidoreductase [Candidatus Sulfotelmatobacter sp.]
MLAVTTVRTTTLSNGEPIPVLGQGTWGMAERKHPRKVEIQALRTGIDLGMTLIDTAEMYANGGAEKLVGEAISGHRDQVFLVSKVLPHNATRSGTMNACERSLRRLKTDRLDLYLLHWRERVPLDETISAFQALLHDGKIRYWGVSNFDVSDMKEVVSLSGGEAVATDQVLYNLSRRGIEYDLLPWCQKRHIPIMAYSPIEQGRMLDDTTLRKIAKHHGATPAQVALAWVIRQDKVVAIPRAGVPEHVLQNRGALDLHLTNEDLADLDRVFPPPSEPRSLEMI